MPLKKPTTSFKPNFTKGRKKQTSPNDVARDEAVPQEQAFPTSPSDAQTGDASDATPHTSTPPQTFTSPTSPHIASLAPQIFSSPTPQILASATPPTIALSEDGGTPSNPKQKKASRKQAKPRTLAASSKKKAHVNLVQSDNDEEVEIVSGPPQYNRGKTVLGGSNAGKRDDLTHRPLFWGGDGPDFGDRDMTTSDAFLAEQKAFKSIEEELKEHVIKDYTKRLTAEVTKKLRQEKVKGIENDVQEKYRAEFELRKCKWRMDVREEVEKEMKADVEKQLRFELRAVVEEEFEEDLREQLRDVARIEVRAEVIRGTTAEMRAQIRTDLLEEVEDEVRANTERDLRASIEIEIKQSMAAEQQRQDSQTRSKKEQALRQKIEKELRAKLMKETFEAYQAKHTSQDDINERANWEQETQSRIEERLRDMFTQSYAAKEAALRTKVAAETEQRVRLELAKEYEANLQAALAGNSANKRAFDMNEGSSSCKRRQPFGRAEDPPGF